MHTLTIRTPTPMSESEKDSFDMRCKARGQQVGLKERHYQLDRTPGECEDIAADIRGQWRATVKLTGDARATT